MATTCRESARECLMSSPLRASEPTTRVNTSSDGTCWEVVNTTAGGQGWPLAALNPRAARGSALGCPKPPLPLTKGSPDDPPPAARRAGVVGAGSAGGRMIDGPDVGVAAPPGVP